MIIGKLMPGMEPPLWLESGQPTVSPSDHFRFPQAGQADLTPLDFSHAPSFLSSGFIGLRPSVNGLCMAYVSLFSYIRGISEKSRHLVEAIRRKCESPI